jgi:hypothetical protein
LLTRARVCPSQLRPLREEGLFCAALAARFSVEQIATPAGATTTATSAATAEAAAGAGDGCDADGRGLGIFRLRPLPPPPPPEAALAHADNTHAAARTDA